ncbi:unnamed protein product [Laminaria digitata]
MLSVENKQSYNLPGNDSLTNQRAKAIILITDGCISGGSTAHTAARGAIQRMAALMPNPVKTYVVGFGSGVCPDELNDYATDGGTARSGGPNMPNAPKYYDASNSTELANDLRAIITSTISCSYNISTNPNQFDPNKIWVSYTINGQTTQVAEGGNNGYAYDGNNNTLTINGSNCDTIKNADPSTTTVDIVVGCRTDCVPSQEVCDYVDNNCNGQIDEIAACQGCVPETCDGQDNDCDGVIDNGCPPDACIPEPEICGDNMDNDCDSQIDEGCASMMCTPTAEICGDMVDNDCDMQIDEGCPPPQGCIPSAEICDGMDNNCDSVVDEGCAPACVPENEICDGIDNDCDNVVDNDCIECPNGRSDEVCDGEDNDCDGEVDEGCGGMCVPQNEICDGLDDDCDGVVDNDCIECPFGRNEEICNGGDDDCDGETDEGCANG